MQLGVSTEYLDQRQKINVHYYLPNFNETDTFFYDMLNVERLPTQHIHVDIRKCLFVLDRMLTGETHRLGVT
jgi:hypothetical protein